jgi:hypothetical protein
VEENEPKEDARAPLNPARRQCERRASELAVAQTGRRALPVHIADARRGTKGFETQHQMPIFGLPIEFLAMVIQRALRRMTNMERYKNNSRRFHKAGGRRLGGVRDAANARAPQ